MNLQFLSPRMLLGLVVAAPAAIAILPQVPQAQARAALVAPQVMDAAAVNGVPDAAIAPGPEATYGRLRVAASSQVVTPHAQRALEQSLAQASTPEEWGEASQRDYDANRDFNRDFNRDARYDYRPRR